MATGDPLHDRLERGELAAAGARVREEWRADEEEYARAAAARWAHGRRLVDIARELMHRGDTVAVLTGTATFTGVVEDVGVDYFELRSAAGRVLVNLAAVTTGGGKHEIKLAAPVALRVVERARRGGRRGGGSSSTFRARLLAYEQDEREVDLASHLLGEEFRGRPVVGRDHVCLRAHDGNATYVPLAWLTWVRVAPT